MGYALTASTSFCTINDRTIFLNVRDDRYFCLSARVEQSFMQLVQGKAVGAADIDLLDGLVTRGILMRNPSGGVPAACRAPTLPRISFVDRCGPVDRSSVALAAAQLLRTRLALRMRSLHTVLHALTRAKATTRHVQCDVPSLLQSIAWSFDQTAMLVSRQDQCLPRSIAIAHRLARLGVAAHLVIGVKLRPFAAHCWVQTDDRLVNDRADTVRNFTPILVL